jgi:hypothetical protein
VLWGAGIIVRWLLSGMPIYEGSAYARGQNMAILFSVVPLLYGLWCLKRAKARDDEDK